MTVLCCEFPGLRCEGRPIGRIAPGRLWSVSRCLWRPFTALVLGWTSSLCALCPAAPLDGKIFTDNTLTSAIVPLIRQTPIGNAKIGVFVQAVDTNEVLVNIAGDEPLTPASCFKLFTTAAGLVLLGPDYTWHTDLASPGAIEDGTLKGDLFVIGHGDPALGGRFNPSDTTDLTWQFREWAAKLKELGIHKINGDIVGDDDYFDDVQFGRAWYPDERAEWYCAEVSALSFNDACIDILWRPGKRRGDAATFTLNPPTKYCEIVNKVETVPAGTKNWDITYTRPETSNEITAKGKIPLKEKKYDFAAIHNPTLFTVTVLEDTLKKEGIDITGQPRDIDDLQDKDKAREGMKTLFSHTSPPLSQTIEVLNRNSQNLYAELLLRTLGRARGTAGSFEQGCQVVEDFLRGRGLLHTGYVCIDGSGLSYLNRTSTRQLVDLLRFMHFAKDYPVYLNSLPEGGVRGSLKARFQDDERSKQVAERIYAKTGWIGGVHSLSGYVQGAPPIAFSIILNDFECPDRQARDLVDRIAVEIAQWNAPKTQ